METQNEDLIRQLQESLDAAASPKTRDWWEKYMRNVIPFRGVGIPEIRARLADWRVASKVANWDDERQLTLALQLFEFTTAEDKLAGILFLQEYLYDKFNWSDLLPKYAELYQRRLIFDWNTCDWFCVRVLGPTIALHGMDFARTMVDWSREDYLWQARSGVVAFVPVSADQRYAPLIYSACENLIVREERFAKTAVGWILRDLSRQDRAGVLEFVESRLGFFSIEALKNTLKYLDPDDRKAYVRRLKAGKG